MIRRLVPLALILALFAALGAQGALAAPAGPPTGVTAIALSGQAQIAWQPVQGATSYVVLRGTSSSNISTTVTPSGGTTGTSFTNTGLSNSTTYYYVVRAVGDSVTSANSTIAQVTPRSATCSGANAIVTENCFPGTTGWKTTNVADVADAGIEGYATQSSINKGEAVDIKVNTGAGASYRAEIYRSGNYAGDQGRLISTIPNLVGVAQPSCATQSTTGLMDCANWSTSFTITTTSSWRSGVYLIRLVRSNGTDFHVILTVRDDGASSDVVYVVPDTTYQAYNNYGGKSLYSWNSTGANTLSGADRAVKVSYDRPYEQVRSSQRDWYTYSDLRMVSWLESEGYNVDYVAGTDLDRDPSVISGATVVVLGGHDEYYSSQMRSTLTGARNAGTSMFFSGANSMYWQIRFEASPTTGASRRTQVAYKTVESGPADPQGPTSTWRDPNGANQPENGFVGIMYLGDSDFTYFPLRVSAAEGQDPTWRHTPLATMPAGTYQEVGGGIVGWEWDGRVDNGSQPAGLTVLASSPVTGNLSQGNGATTTPGSTVSNVTRYTAASGASVFATGTNYWNRGLDRDMDGNGEPNNTIAQATVNTLADMGALPASPDPDMVLDTDSPPEVLMTIPANAATGVAVDASPVALFSRPMNASTITSSTVSLRTQAGTAVPATITYNSTTRRVTIDPTANLALQTNYIARVTTGAKATDGTAMTNQFEWSFRTADPPPPPTVTATTPATGATGINPAMPLTATFSRDMDPATITTSSFTLSGPGGAAVPATVSYDAATQRATLTPGAALALNTAYTARLTTAIKAADGTAMASQVQFNFSTWANAPPPPTVTQTSPAAGANGVAVGTTVSATFSRDMNANTITGQTVTLVGPGTQPVPATVTYDAANRRAVITPAAPLAVSTTFRATLSTAVTSADGVTLASPVTFQFTTSSSPCPCQLFPDATVPDVTANPVQDNRGGSGPFTYEMGVKVTATAAAEIRSVRFYKSPGETGTHVGRVWTSGGTQLAQVTFAGESASGWQTQQLTTPVPVAAGQTYVVSVNNNTFYPLTSQGLASQRIAGPVRSVVGGNGVYGASAGTFPTSSWNDSNYFVDLVVGADSTPTPTTPPTVTDTTPSSGSTNVSIAVSPSATFSRPMDPATLTAATATVRPTAGGSAVPAAVTYDAAENRVTINPTDDLDPTTAYTAQVSTAARSANDIALDAPVSWSFTTAAAPAAGATSQLFPDTTVPSAPANSVQDGRTGSGPFTYEMGVKVTATQGSEIRAIRYYRSPGESGTHVGRIWTSGGTQLAQVTFTGESASGWQTQPLISAVPLTAGQTYVISVNQNVYYPLSTAGLASAISAGPVRTIVGSNGVFGGSAGTFPTSSWNNSNYFVDLQVIATEAVPTTPPTVTGTSPGDNGLNVSTDVSPTATFSRAMDPATLTGATFTLRTQSGDAVPATVSYDDATRTATIDPAADLTPDTNYTAQITTGAKAANNVALAAPVTWSFITSAASSTAATYQLFPGTLTPEVDGQTVQDNRVGAGPFTYEMGVKITPTAPSELRAIRYFKTANETGTHVGRIWTSGGTQIAQVTFSGETFTGWQQQSLVSAVSLTPGQTYIVSVNRNDYYGVTPAGLASQITAGPVRTIVGSNGVFADAAGVFPTSSWNSSNYFTDLVVVPTGDPVAIDPPEATATTPADDATGIAVGTSPTATFSQDMDPSTLTTATVTLRPDGGQPLDATVGYDAATNRVTINPAEDLNPGQVYTAQVSTGAKGADGEPLAAPVTWSFTTAAPPATDQLFPNTTTPTADGNPVADGRSGPGPFTYEMGVKVEATADTQIHGIRFWKSPGETGEHVGRIWTSGGTQLKQVTFTGEGASGWQSAVFDAPLAIQAGQTYVISVNRNDFYPLTPGGLANQITAGPVRTVVGGNGVFSEAAGTFPTGSYADGDYLVDLMVGDLPTAPPPTPPVVSSTSPADGATGVAPATSPTATFSRAMNPATLTGASVTLRPAGGDPVDATVTYNATTRRVVIDPAAALQPGQQYVAQISTAATSSAGAALGAAYSWSFTVSPPPAVTATSPADGARRVAVNASPTATFSRAMSSFSLTSATATVRVQGGAVLPAAVSYDADAKKVTINPAGDLTPATTYVAQISTGAKSADGITLAAPVEWTFRTAAVSPTVTAATPADGATDITLGVSPTATFSKAMDPATLDGTSITLRAGTNDPVPAAITYAAATNRVTIDPTSDLDPGTTYTARITNAAISADDGELVPFSWSFTTLPRPTVTAVTPADGATGQALAVSPTATFSRAMNAATINATNVTIRPAAGGANLASVVSYDAANNRVTINPNANLAVGTAYTVQIAGAVTTSDGVTLGAPYTWTFTSQTAPTVTTTDPAADATGVAPSISPTATFSRAMSSSSLSSSSVTLRRQSDNSSVFGTVSYDSGNNRVTFNPLTDLNLNTTYVLTISTGATSADGIPLASAYTLRFTTAAAPTVTATSPASNATNVSTGVTATATFSRAMNPSSLTTSTATIRRTSTGQTVTASVSYDAANNRVSINPSSALLASTQYTAQISTGAEASDGVNLASTYSWSFTTIAAPTVTATTPATNTQGVAVGTSPTATFSRAMDPATLTTSTANVRATGTGTVVPATVTYDTATNRVTIDPTADLAAGTAYTAQITTGATAADGSPLTATVSWVFSTPAVQLFADTLTPATPATANTTIKETGVRLTVTDASQIRSIRYWKSPGETGTHTGRIWNQNGTQVGSVVFTGETASGWQTMNLASPVTLTVGQTYTVSVNRNNFYPSTTNGLSSQVIAGPVRTVVGTNGVYATSAGSRPTLSSGNSNYFVDVIVAPTL